MGGGNEGAGANRRLFVDVWPKAWARYVGWIRTQYLRRAVTSRQWRPLAWCWCRVALAFSIPWSSRFGELFHSVVLLIVALRAPPFVPRFALLRRRVLLLSPLAMSRLYGACAEQNKALVMLNGPLCDNLYKPMNKKAPRVEYPTEVRLSDPGRRFYSFF